MSTLTIPVSDTVLDQLRKQAKAKGVTTEELAAEKLSFAAQLPSGYGRISRFAGSMPSDLTEASERVDEYTTETKQ
jgi:hypothetical protein